MNTLKAKNGYYAEYQDGDLFFFDEFGNSIGEWDLQGCLIKTEGLSQGDIESLPELFKLINEKHPEWWGQY